EIHATKVAIGADASKEPIKLNTNDYFPFGPGEIHTRLWVSRHARMNGSAGKVRAWQALAEKIRARYHRLYPESYIQDIEFVKLTWPRSPKGYEKMKNEIWTKRSIIFAEHQ